MSKANMPLLIKKISVGMKEVSVRKIVATPL
jgi:hypothetical protein